MKGEGLSGPGGPRALTLSALQPWEPALASLHPLIPVAAWPNSVFVRLSVVRTGHSCIILPRPPILPLW